MLANTMAAELMRKRMKELVIIVQSKRARPIPVTASGGIKATEIAIPGSVLLSSGFTMANDAASPATIAIAAKIILVHGKILLVC